MIKKLVCALLGIILCFGFVISVSAADTPIHIDEVGLSISVPENAMIFTRDTPADDSNLAQLGWSKSSLDEMLQSSNMYLDAFDINISYEITMTYVKLGFGDFNEMSDSNINSYIKGASEALESAGATVIKSSIYQHSQVKFAVIISQQSPIFGKSSNAVSYMTIFNGNIYTIAIKDFYGDLTPADEAFAQRIIDSVKFDKATSSSKASSVPKDVLKTGSTASKTSSIASSQATSSKAAVSSVQSMVPSSAVTYPAPSAPSTLTTAQVNQYKYGHISLWAIFLTIIIFTAPIAIYRYTNIKHAVEPKKALKITIFYGIAGVAVTAFLAVFSEIGLACVGMVMIWSIVIYLILTKGGSQRDQEFAEAEPQNEIPVWRLYGQSADSFKIDVQPTAAEQDVAHHEDQAGNQSDSENPSDTAPTVPEPIVSENETTPKFCYYCGNKLLPTSKFCPKCGTKVEKLGDE